MKEIWIEARVENRFTAKSGAEMVSFDVKRPDGRNWEATLRLVEKQLGAGFSPGMAVQIQIDGDWIKSVRRSLNISRQATILPYGFVSIDPAKAVTDAPVWHDGKEGGELLSGELRCTLEALTPLLPGNARYKVQELGQAGRERLQTWDLRQLDPEKQIAEPLRLADGRVVIGGSALKGMIRHSLGALLSAPMERVAERHYTYRPNLNHDEGDPWLVCRPAIVRVVDNDHIEVDVLPAARSAVFLHTKTHADFKSLKVGETLKGKYNNVAFGIFKFDKKAKKEVFKEDQSKLSDKHGSAVELNHVVVLYKGGMDGNGEFARAFNKRSVVHAEALIRVADLAIAEKNRRVIPVQIVQRYKESQALLADDQNGHITNSHPLASKLKANGLQKAKSGIVAATELQLNQLVYVEIEGNNRCLGEVRSIGHHYQYRWNYTSSVRQKNGQPRACLIPADSERISARQTSNADVKPDRLTGARLLFGYVRDEKTNPIGRGVFERLAGRIAINNAVSVAVPKFLGKPEQGYCVPLKILGQPKASAWEFYLRQDGGKNQPPATYGDLPGDTGGELVGRKFYRHQPRCQAVSNIAAADQDTDTIRSNQATLARFICQAGTRFRFAIRFQGLRAWELGALLAVLQPGRLAAPSEEGQVYAHKLGLGRPLGMGSVRIDIDGLTLSQGKGAAEAPATDGFQQEAIKALRERLAGVDPSEWLAMLRFEDRGLVDYPRGKDDAIFNWHTDLRREYSKLRRQANPDWKPLN